MSDGASSDFAIVFYDDARARNFQPFALSRPLSEMRSGALLVRERWEQAFRAPSIGFVSSPQLARFDEPGAPSAISGTISRGSVLVNSRASIVLDHADRNAGVWAIDNHIAAIRLSDDLDTAQLADGMVTLDDIAQHATSQPITCNVSGVWMNEVWDFIRFLSPMLVNDIPTVAERLGCTALEQGANGPMISGAHEVFVESGAHVEPFTFFDTSLGPVLLRADSHVQAFTRMIGPCYVGEHTSVVADRISGSSIGNTCRVHGELSASIFIGHSNKGHDGFVGHSILGRWVNLGAGTTTSNLKNTYGTVALWTPQGVRDTGLQFLGTMFGDHVKTGIGLRLTTGCVLGTGANVFDNMPPKAVAPFSWGQGAPYLLFDETKFLETAERMMGRRQITLSDAAREYLHAVFDARWKTS